MVQGSINIDDAGNPGADSGSDFLSPTRKSWTAVIIPSSMASEISAAMDIFLTGVRGEFGVQEIHFTDIYSGRGVWRGVAIAKRIEIFELMKGIMESFSLPVVHRTVSAETLNDHHETVSRFKPAPGSWWNIQDIPHFGFLLLCSNVSQHLRGLCAEFPQDFKLPLRTYVDEGIANAGTFIELPNWGDVIESQKVLFCNSKDRAEIQIADFAAFSISRTQWIMAQQKLGQSVSRGDLEFLKTTSNFNILNLPKVEFSIENISRESFEFFLSRDRREKDLSGRPRKFPGSR
jgi:hypothetical protein